MKRIFVILLTFVLLLGICPMSALAETGGSGNVDGGGGDMGQGTSQNSWNPGMDGVRITVVDAESGQPVSSSFDLTNKTPSIKIHFGKVSKIQYANGASISPTTGNYDYYTPATPMPRIVSSGSQNASIEAIKKYFCSEYAVKLVAQQTGIAYEELIGGQYKLFLEPIAYFKHNGIMMAMTAHEAALYDNQAGGSLRKTMTSLTHKNLPLAMFLEYADMGFPAYTGATNKTCSNDSYFQNANTETAVVWRDWKYKVGDHILFNDTDRFSLLYNNLKGQIVQIELFDSRIRFTVDVEIPLTEQDCQNDGIEFIDIIDDVTRIRFDVFDFEEEMADEDRKKTIVPFQLAYAVSIHKAQGLEYRSVKVVIPSSNAEKITHGIFYTAITRAKEKLKIYWSSETMQEVVAGFSIDTSRQKSLAIIKEKLKQDKNT